MSVIIVPVSPYVKKEDGAQYFKNHITGIVIMSVIYTIVPFFFITMLRERILSLSNMVDNVQQNLLFGSFFLFASIATYLLLTLPIIFQKEYKQNYFRKLNKYAKGEIINISNLIDQKRTGLAVGLYILLLMVGLFFYMIPVISLTAN